MEILTVVKYGHPSLRRIAQACRPEEVDRQFIQNMIATMQQLDGAGLAATQVNADLQLIIAAEPDNGKVHVLFNPKIIGHSEKMVVDIEGCLSLPQLQAEVPRFERIVVHAQTPEGEAIEITTKGLFARILQHEIDHLNGVLYIDRADLSTLVRLRKKVNSDQIIKEPITLAEVKEDFRRRYHQIGEPLVFDPLPKA